MGALTLVIPFVELFKPGQPAPYSEFPYIALAIVAVSVLRRGSSSAAIRPPGPARGPRSPERHTPERSHTPE